MADESPDRRHQLPGFDSRFLPDSIDGPVVRYRPHTFQLEYLATSMDHWVRATFDRLDSHQVSRGEHLPYEPSGGRNFDPVTVVRPSRWLTERYLYESRFYRHDYVFTRSVDEMLTEFEHYLFSFHDQFVEVIAGGVHFDAVDRPGLDDALVTRPGWARLENKVEPVVLGQEEAKLFLRESDETEADLLAASQLCDQVMLQVDTAPNPTSMWPAMRLTLRNRDGLVMGRLRDSFGGIVATYDGVPDKRIVLDRIDQWNVERVERMRRMRRQR